LKLDIAPSVPQ